MQFSWLLALSSIANRILLWVCGVNPNTMEWSWLPPPIPLVPSTPIFDLLVAIRKGIHTCTKHPISKCFSYGHLPPSFKAFFAPISSIKSYHKAFSNPRWWRQWKEEMHVIPRILIPSLLSQTLIQAPSVRVYAALRCPLSQSSQTHMRFHIEIYGTLPNFYIINLKKIQGTHLIRTPTYIMGSSLTFLKAHMPFIYRVDALTIQSY